MTDVLLIRDLALPTPAEGIRLVRAFMQIASAADRMRLIELAESLKGRSVEPPAERAPQVVN